MPTESSTPSNLGCALLGLLARSPSTGYDLARRMERPVGYFWSARHSQIYPELAKLERAGLVSHEVVDGAYVKGEQLEFWVWSPQGIEDMHRPSTWGILRF